MTEAWVGSTPLQCVEGTRVLQLEGCTVSVISVFPDNTAYVITRKTFEKRVIDAARRKWKMQTYTQHYATSSNPFGQQWDQAYQAQAQSTQQQARDTYAENMDAFQSYIRQRQKEQEQSVKDDMEKHMRDMLNDLWRKY